MQPCLSGTTRNLVRLELCIEASLHTSTADAQSTATTNTPTISTTVEPNNMCTVLQQIASRAPDDFVCSTNQQCDGVDCTADLSGSHYRSQAVILVCQLPHPAVNVVLMTQSGVVLVNETVDHSDVVSFHQLLQLNITLDQLKNAIGFQVFMQCCHT